MCGTCSAYSRASHCFWALFPSKENPIFEMRRRCVQGGSIAEVRCLCVGQFPCSWGALEIEAAIAVQIGLGEALDLITSN